MPYANRTNQDSWSPPLHSVWSCSYSQSRNCEPHVEEKAETGLRWGSSALNTFPCCEVDRIPGNYLCPVSKLQVLLSRVKLVFEVEFPTCSRVKGWTLTCRIEDLPSLQDCRKELEFWPLRVLNLQGSLRGPL